jgi:hypothetical protein
VAVAFEAQRCPSFDPPRGKSSIFRNPEKGLAREEDAMGDSEVAIQAQHRAQGREMNRNGFGMEWEG